MNSIICTAGIIRRNGKILIARRKPDSKLEPLKWEFPGGKIEFGEDPKACLQREIMEEMDFRVTVKTIYEVSSYNYRREGEVYHVLLLCYLCDYAGGEPRVIDCHEICWVKPGELAQYDFAAADVPVVQKICAQPPFK